MKILLLIHAFNALSQRLFVELEAMGHAVSIEFDIHDATTREAIALFKPDLILAPYLKRAIPEDIWRDHLCLILHPGPLGDRGPSALDWAILKGEPQGGATLLQAEAKMDAGPVWATQSFPLDGRSKSSLYRREVTEAAVTNLRQALDQLSVASFQPRRWQPSDADIIGDWQPSIKQADRAIDWALDDTDTVLRKIRSADGVPGLLDKSLGDKIYLYDAHEAQIDLTPFAEKKTGDLIAISGQAICRKTTDGAVWIGHLKDATNPHPFKLPARKLLETQCAKLPEIVEDNSTGYPTIHFETCDGVTHLHFPFYNGAMATDQCEALLAAYKHALKEDSRVIVLHGGPDFWSNGMHLNVIEAANNPADESWRNINAIDDLAEAIIRTDSHITVAAMHGNAGAGGVFLARACDHVWLRDGIILNPHYKDMGNLFGSEFWTYLLPRYAGEDNSQRISDQRLPMGASEACTLGLADRNLSKDRSTFAREVAYHAKALTEEAYWSTFMAEKKVRRARDESEKPLSDYRAEELARMKQNFYGFDPSYHVARYNFVYKISKSRTPITLARHRDKRPHDRTNHKAIS